MDYNFGAHAQKALKLERLEGKPYIYIYIYICVYIYMCIYIYIYKFLEGPLSRYALKPNPPWMSCNLLDVGDIS